MSKIKVELNTEGVEELLREGMKPIISAKAQEVADRSGEGYESYVFDGATRCVGWVYPATPEATADNEENNTVLGALM